MSLEDASDAQADALVRRVFWVLFISTFAAMLGVGIIVPFIPHYAAQMGASGKDIGLIVAGFAIARMIGLPLVATFADAVGHKRLFLTGLISYAALSLAYIEADTVALLSAVRFLHGFAAAIILPMAMSFIGDIAPPEGEGALMGRFNVALFLGFGGGPALGGALSDRFGQEAAFIGMGVLSFIAFVLVLLLLPRQKVRHRDPGAGAAEETGGEADDDFSGIWKVKYIRPLKSKVFRGIFLFRFISAIGRTTNMTFLPLFAVTIGMSMELVGYTISAQLITASLLQPLFGKVADRANRTHQVIAGSAITGACLIFVPSSPSFAMVFVLCVLMGIAGAIAMPAASAIGVTEGRTYGMLGVMALFQTGMGAGQIFGPMVGGVIYDVSTMAAPFYYASAATFAGAALFYYYQRTATPETEASATAVA